MKFTINKGRHRAWPPVFGIFYNKRHMERDVIFNLSFKYDLPGIYDDGDINKLFGIGYLPGHHTDSARFGCVYNKASGNVDLYAYCYVNGERIFKFICEVKLHDRVRYSLDIIGDVYSFTVQDPFNTYRVYGGCDISFTHKKRLSYRLGCYFGGNIPAPHTITIEMKKK